MVRRSFFGKRFVVMLVKLEPTLRKKPDKETKKRIIEPNQAQD